MTSDHPAPLSPLIGTQALQDLLGNPDLRIFDTTVHLRPKAGGGYEVASGRPDYEAAHLPGAGFIDVVWMCQVEVHTSVASDRYA